MKITLQIIALIFFTSISIMAQETIDQKTVAEKYNEVSSLTTLSERREFFGNQSEDMRIALWLENIKRKTENANLSAEQIEIIEIIKEKFITVEFALSQRGKKEADAPEEFHEIMNKANKLLGKKMVGELFGILGDTKSLEGN